MQEFQLRVIEEMKHLDEKINALQKFTYTQMFNSLSELEQSLLTRQLNLMVEYSDTLYERIKLFDEDGSLAKECINPCIARLVVSGDRKQNAVGEGYLQGFKDGYEQCSADEASGDWTEDSEQLNEYALRFAENYLEVLDGEEQLAHVPAEIMLRRDTQVAKEAYIDGLCNGIRPPDHIVESKADQYIARKFC